MCHTHIEEDTVCLNERAFELNIEHLGFNIFHYADCLNLFKNNGLHSTNCKARREPETKGATEGIENFAARVGG